VTIDAYISFGAAGPCGAVLSAAVVRADCLVLAIADNYVRQGAPMNAVVEASSGVVNEHRELRVGQGRMETRIGWDCRTSSLRTALHMDYWRPSTMGANAFLRGLPCRAVICAATTLQHHLPEN
jgi:hypothetical protein